VEEPHAEDGRGDLSHRQRMKALMLEMLEVEKE